MTMVGGGDDMTAMLMQFMAQQQAVRRERAAALLNSLVPGEAVGEQGAKALKRVSGRKVAPTHVLKPHTLETALDEASVAAFHALPPNMQVAAAQNKVLNAATGTTGVQTRESYANTQRTVGNTTSMQSHATGKARAAMVEGKEPTTDAEKNVVAIGQELGVGKTTGQAASERATQEVTVASAPSQIAAAKTSEMANLYVQDFLKNPANSSWGALLAKRGVDPIAAAQAFASGQGGLLSNFIEGDRQTLLAKLQLAANKDEVASELAKARIRTAEDVSKHTGIGVRSILALENAVEGGKNPFEAGVSSDDVQLWLKSKDLTSSAYLREQVNKNNPILEMFKGQMDVIEKSAGNTDFINSMNGMLATGLAQVITQGELGERPGAENPTGQELWDKRARYNYSILGVQGKEPKSLLFDVLRKDPMAPLTEGPEFMRKTPADTSATGGEGTVKDATDTKKKAPSFTDPSASKATQQFLRLGRDSTLFKKP